MPPLFHSERHMSKRFKGQSAKVSVSLNFNAQTDTLVDKAVQYCLRTGSSLRLVHVCEPYSASAWSTMMAGEMVLTDMLDIALEKAKAAAAAKLFDISRRFDGKLPMTSAILIGLAAEMIIADAQANNVSLIMVGASQQSHRFIPRGMSVALSLMGNSPIPVMVLTEGETLNFSKDRLKLLISDDLREQSRSAVTGACDLAFALGRADVKHFHVNGITVDTLRAALEFATTASHSSSGAAFSAESVHQTTVKQLEQKLASRAGDSVKNLLAIGAKYENELVTAPSVTESVGKLAADWDADIICFGRHHTVHRKPFLIGQLPFYSMLSIKRPLVIFPDDAP